jgi:hypothetical protein
MTHPVGAFSSAARPAPARYAAGLRALPTGQPEVCVHQRPHA